MRACSRDETAKVSSGRTVRVFLLVAIVSLLVAVTALSASGAPSVREGTGAVRASTNATARAVPVPVTARLRTRLRAAFLRAHRGYERAEVRGPLRRTVRHARYRGIYWALASFSVPKLGTQDQPELFRRRIGYRWRDRGDTGGSLCEVPRPVVVVWDLLSWRTGC